MRIAIVGAPGSGKTELAKALEKVTGLPIIDNYVEQLEKRTNVSLGFNASLVPNAAVVFDRLTHEWDTAKYVDGYILCGTVLESACYAAIWASNTQQAVTDAIAHRQATNAVMDMFAIVTIENWLYDLVFYLPSPQDASKLVARLDYSIRDGFAMMNIDHIPLTDEDPIKQGVTLVKERLEQLNAESKKVDE